MAGFEVVMQQCMKMSMTQCIELSVSVALFFPAPEAIAIDKVSAQGQEEMR